MESKSMKLYIYYLNIGLFFVVQSSLYAYSKETALLNNVEKAVAKEVKEIVKEADVVSLEMQAAALGLLQDKINQQQNVLQADIKEKERALAVMIYNLSNNNTGSLTAIPAAQQHIKNLQNKLEGLRKQAQTLQMQKDEAILFAALQAVN